VVSFLQVSSPKPCAHRSSPHTRYIPRPSHFLYFITRKILGEQYRSLSSSLCIFLHSPVTSSLLGPNILTPYSQTPSAYVSPSMWATKFHTHTKQRAKLKYSTIYKAQIFSLNTLFSDTFSLRFSLNVSDQVSHPHKTTGKIKVQYDLKTSHETYLNTYLLLDGLISGLNPAEFLSLGVYEIVCILKHSAHVRWTETRHTAVRCTHYWRNFLPSCIKQRLRTDPYFFMIFVYLFDK
jgi:hypothetical protein